MSEQIMNSCCRVCLQSDGEMLSVLDELDGYFLPLKSMIENCGDIKIDLNDFHPKWICTDCTQELLIAIKFKEKCRKSEEILSSLESKLKMENDAGDINDGHDNNENDDDDDNNIEMNDYIFSNENSQESNIEQENIPSTVKCFKSETEIVNTKPDSQVFEESENIDHSVITIENQTVMPPTDSFEDIEYLEVDQDVEYILSSTRDNGSEIVQYENEAGEKSIGILIDDVVQQEEHEGVVKTRRKRITTQFESSPPSTTTVINHNCELCGAGFTHLMNLKRHIKTVHQIDTVLTCPVCSHLFTTDQEFQLHVEIHKNQIQIPEDRKASIEIVFENKTEESTDDPRRPFKCEICSKRFISNSALIGHMRIHTGERPFACTVCRKRFTTVGGLDLHQRRHSGFKPYKCDYCDKGFVETSNLKVHMRTHTGEKPHVCTYCGKGFGRVYLLQLHLRTHTGEKPYNCSHCTKSFAQQGDLAAHVRIHTGERPHKCTVCHKGFIKSSGLLSHMKRHEPTFHRKPRENNTMTDNSKPTTLTDDFIEQDDNIISMISFTD